MISREACFGLKPAPGEERFLFQEGFAIRVEPGAGKMYEIEPPRRVKRAQVVPLKDVRSLFIYLILY